MVAKTQDGFNIDIPDIINFSIWLAVLAAPHLYRTMTRKVDPAHLLPYMDAWIAYADRGDIYQGASFNPVPYEQRPALARKLRSLIAAWTPPELPVEITETARALLHAEGLKPPNGKDWDEADFDLEKDGLVIEDMLLWPEGIPMLLRRNKIGQGLTGAGGAPAPR